MSSEIKIVEGEALRILKQKLKNRFIILNLLEQVGPEWAAKAIDPNNSDNWTHDEYLECYNNPKA